MYVVHAFGVPAQPPEYAHDWIASHTDFVEPWQYPATGLHVDVGMSVAHPGVAMHCWFVWISEQSVVSMHFDVVYVQPS